VTSVGGLVASPTLSFYPIRQARKAHDGRQPGNPDLAADAVLQILQAGTPPVHLLLGSDALQAVAGDRARFVNEIQAWRALSQSTDYARQAIS
jgi:hypothetical protein